MKNRNYKVWFNKETNKLTTWRYISISDFRKNPDKYYYIGTRSSNQQSYQIKGNEIGYTRYNKWICVITLDSIC